MNNSFKRRFINKLVGYSCIKCGNILLKHDVSLCEILNLKGLPCLKCWFRCVSCIERKAIFQDFECVKLGKCIKEK